MWIYKHGRGQGQGSIFFAARRINNDAIGRAGLRGCTRLSHGLLMATRAFLSAVACPATIPQHHARLTGSIRSAQDCGGCPLANRWLQGCPPRIMQLFFRLNVIMCTYAQPPDHKCHYRHCIKYRKFHRRAVCSSVHPTPCHLVYSVIPMFIYLPVVKCYYATTPSLTA